VKLMTQQEARDRIREIESSMRSLFAHADTLDPEDVRLTGGLRNVLRFGETLWYRLAESRGDGHIGYKGDP
jgi:hypothetical protein